MGVPLLSTGAMNSIYFGFYGSSLDFLSQRRYNLQSSSKTRTKVQGEITQNSTNRARNVVCYGNYFIAGCIGGAAQLVVACPVDLVKVQLQSQIHKAAMKGPMDCVVKIVSSKGILGLYKGLLPQAWRDIPSSGLYFAIYEFLKRQLSFEQESTKFAQFMAGGIAGTLSWWSIIPLDVIKSRIQGDSSEKPKYKGILHCGSVIMKTHGLKAFFHGFWPLSIRAFPVNGTTWLVYEFLFQHCTQLPNNLYS
ncbi:unnamed protein product [Orchesella dallaii]|uniref:Solute carrier family 25 member 45 n=1 Tax=Orchesella dallaii TaxID=48710 RepID=A0ABP1S1F3_9HEXA